MKNQQNDIWVGVEQVANDPQYIAQAQQEFVELPVVGSLADEKILDTTTNRRDFLKYLGFGLGAATIAASCDIPIKKVMPYTIKPDAIVPGVATYYASSFVNGGDYCSVLVKTREGRPIKIEGNPSSQVTWGGTSARAQAVVLSLYDSSRFPAPRIMGDGKWFATEWVDIDKEIKAKLTAASQIRIITNTILSPTTKRALDEFKAKFPNTKVATYDAVSSAAILLANEKCFGDRSIPNYKFQEANVIVSFDADFLGTWISPIEYATQYIKNRRISDVKNAKMSRHIQVESRMSLTGSNADNRILVKPSEQGAAILALYNALGGGASSLPLNEKASAAIKKVAAELQANQGKCLVVSASNDINEQIIVNKINEILGSYGTTIDFAEASLQRQGVESDVQAFVKEMQAGSVDAVLFMGGANPAFDLPNAAAFVEALSKVKTRISFAISPDETTNLCNYIAPNHHQLESWGDAEPKRGHFSLLQPSISPLFKTRQTELSLLAWCDSANVNWASDQPYFDYLKKAWEGDQFAKQNAFASFQSFWDNSLHDGVATSPSAAKTVSFAGDAQAAASKIKKPSADLEISLYETINMGAGQYANNPWLQEMPDPVMRTVWGNYLAIPIAFDGKRDYVTLNNLKSNMNKTDLADVTVKGAVQRLPVVPQFGQMQGTIAVGLGYGREQVGFAGKNIGKNVQSWMSVNEDGLTQYFATGVTLSEKVGTEDEFACVQYHHTMGLQGKDKSINVDEIEVMPMAEGFQGGLTKRTIIRQTNLKEVGKFTEELHHEREHHQKLNSYTLYPGHNDKYAAGHNWGMHIDLNACIGCGACTVSCMAENNVPIVGKREVFRHHEMTWLRIDRYFYGDVENPNTVYQPMMCQHCDNAPCENVCPVNATNHSSEGLNQMAYNRCVGTRYCANNCPYKVRRFNWLDYTTADLFPANENYVNGEIAPYNDNLVRMVLNPDVTVRSRGVIEKCSFCVQRIQEGKLTAKREGRQLRDADVKTACQTACPTGAIIFGDINNKKGELHKAFQLPLNYIALEEINVQSSVNYTAKVVNRNEELDI